MAAMRWSLPGTVLYMGDMTNLSTGFHLRQWRWRRDDLDVDLTDQVALVGGGNAGIGRATAEALAARGATVHLVCRNEERGLAAVEGMIRATGNDKIHLHVVDLGRPAQVIGFAKAFCEQEERLDMLINNAAVMLGEARRTPDGLETAFATNVVGFYALTHGVLPLLKKTQGARIVNLVSGGMYGARLDLATLKGEVDNYDGALAYACHHRARVALTARWALEFAGNGIAVNCTHPGWVDTPGLAGAAPMAGFYGTFRKSLRSETQGADTAVWLACGKSALAQKGSGRFFVDRAARPLHKLLARTRHTPEVEEELVQLLEQLLAAAQEPDVEVKMQR